MGQTIVLLPDQTDETTGVRTVPVQRPALSRHKLQPVAPGERRDAKAIAAAVVHHLNGKPTEALNCLLEVTPEFQTADFWAALGYIESELGDHSAAAQAYSELVLKEPDATEGWFQWGYCLYKQGRAAAALERFEKAASLKSDWIEIPLARAVCHLNLKQYPAAFEHADECLVMNASYMPALFTKAVAFHVTSELKQAGVLYRQVLELDPAHTEALMNLVTLGLQQKQYDDVRRYSEQLVAIQPDNTLAIEGIAAASFYTGDFENAQQCYARLVELAPDQVSNWLNLGVTNEKRGMLPDAVQAFAKAREIRPDALYAYTYLGAALWKLNDFGAARECYQQAVSKWPDKEELVLSLVQVLEELGCLEDAERACTQFCDRSPESKQAWFRLGYLQFRREMPGAAAESFARALHLQPVWPQAEVNLALACYRDGQLDRAENVANQLLEREPENVEAIKGLATITLAQGRNEQSLELHERLLLHGGPDAEVYYNCGVLSQKLNDLQRAVQFYRQAIAVRPDFAEALLNLGHALKALGDSDEARSVWIPALEIRPEFSLGYFRRS